MAMLKTHLTQMSRTLFSRRVIVQWALLLLVALGIRTAISAAATPLARLAYWHLDENAAASYSDDMGVHPAHCLTNCPGPVPGKINGGQWFDGAGMGLTVAAATEFVWTANDSFTVELWLQGTPGQSCASHDETFIGQGYGDDRPGFWSLGCVAGSGVAAFQLQDEAGTLATLYSPQSVVDGRWHHLVAIRDGASRTNHLVVDGQEVAVSGQDYRGRVAPSHAPISLGHLAGTAFFSGILDEVAVYQGVLPFKEIQTHYYLVRGYGDSCESAVRIMPLGDSITQGYGTGLFPTMSGYNFGYRRPLYLALDSGGYYMNFVGGLQGGQLEIGPPFDFDHEGHPGYRDHQIADNVISYLTAHPADVILLHIGTNDMAQQPGNTNPVDVERILDNVDLFSEDITVVLARIIDQVPTEPAVTTFNNNVATMAQARIAAGDRIILVDQQSALNYTTDMYDALHPNASGYGKMATVWLNALDDFMPVCEGAPVITSTPITTGMSGTPYTYDVEATGALTLQYSLLTAPSGMTITPDNGIINWTPGTNQVGLHMVEVQVSNGSGTDTQSFELNITQALACSGQIISYWQLDEGAGSTTFTDSIGSNHGSCSGNSCPAAASGLVNGAMDFDGTDDFIVVPDDPTLHWENSDSFTVETWVKTTQSCTAQNKVYLGKFRQGSTAGDWWLGCGSNNGPVFFVRDAVNSASVSGPTAINDGSWHHLVGVRDQATDLLKLYVDGVEVASASTANITGSFANNSDLTIGNYNIPNQYHADAVLDEVAIYKTALSPTEITDHYEKSLLGVDYCSVAPLVENVYLPALIRRQ